MGDAELLSELTDAVRLDTEKPVVGLRLNPADPVAIEIVLHEADFAIEGYMEKWKGYRDRFSDPSVYDGFVLDFQTKARKGMKAMISAAQQLIADGPEEDEDDEAIS